MEGQPSPFIPAEPVWKWRQAKFVALDENSQEFRLTVKHHSEKKKKRRSNTWMMNRYSTFMTGDMFGRKHSEHHIGAAKKAAKRKRSHSDSRRPIS